MLKLDLNAAKNSYPQSNSALLMFHVWQQAAKMQHRQAFDLHFKSTGYFYRPKL